MKKPSFIEGVVAALIASVTGSTGYSVLSVFYYEEDTWRILITAISFGYSIYLLIRCRQNTGRIIVLISWLLMSIALWLFHPTLFNYALIHLAVIWLIRSVYFHASMLCVLFDLGLIAFGTALGFLALLHSASVLLCLWCFFLVQALFVALPGSVKKAPAGQSAISSHKKFQQAFQTAQSAVKDLSRS